ncbi:MAG: PEP-CTERM sorting domain-containing protein [Pirellulales bacterium]|nr:PEP-CTERM sorting domain-containing protein [Pirellulales bacterium]
MSLGLFVTSSGTTLWRRIALAVAVCLTCGMPALADPALQEGLFAYWSFDDGMGTTAAEVINGNNAELNGGTWSWGQVGGGLNFNGSSDYALVPNSSTLNPASNALTISCWFLANEFPSLLDEGYGSIFDSRDDNYILYQDRGFKELRFKVTTLNGAVVSQARTGVNEAYLDTSGWHHVVGVYDGGGAWIYYDGQLVNMAGLTKIAGPVRDGQVAAFGAQPGIDPEVDPSINFFNGTVDETAIWNRALSQAEIAYLYNNGMGRSVLEANPTLAPDPMPNPILHYKLDGNLDNSGTLGAAYNARMAGSTGTASYVAGKDGQSLSLVQTADMPTDGVHVEVDYTLPEQGTMVFWAKPSSFYNYNALMDTSIDANQWEMWVYATGVARFRVNGVGFAEYDLDNFGGPDAWHQFAVSWFREKVPDILITSTQFSVSLAINGEHVAGYEADAATWVNPGSKFSIGGGILNAAGNGGFDDFRLYDTVLTMDQIKSLWAPYAQRLPGDANNDGAVDGEDAAILAANWLLGVAGGEDAGDFNTDGTVDDLDLAILAANWAPAGGAAVPEPGALALLIGAVAVLLVRRRR